MGPTVYLVSLSLYAIAFMAIYHPLRSMFSSSSTKLDFFKLAKHFFISLPFFLIFLFFYIGLSLIKDNYHIQKNSFQWLVLVEDTPIQDFPIVESVESPSYSWMGFSEPSGIGGWQLEYVSTASEKQMKAEVLYYLNSNHYQFKEALEPTCSFGHHKPIENGWRVTGSNTRNECIDVLIKNSGSGKYIVLVSLMI